jgi:hypothetical protein
VGTAAIPASDDEIRLDRAHTLLTDIERQCASEDGHQEDPNMAGVLKRSWKVILLAIAIVAVPTAAFAAIGSFTSATGAPAVTGVNSSALTNVSGVHGVASHVGANSHYGVTGAASGTGGIGVRGDGANFGVYSGGNLGVAAGKTLKCTACVTNGALPATLPWTPLTLINGWTGGCFGSGAAQIARGPEGVVHFRGGICSGTSSEPFVLPVPYRPTQTEFIAVDECNATTGRLVIETSGAVIVAGDENPASIGDTPECFTSLAGASYTLPY